MRRVNVLIFIASLFICCPVMGAEEISLTLDEAINIALRDNRDALLKAEDVKKAKERIAEADAGLFPTLNFTATRSLMRGYYPTDIDQTTTQTTLKQYLYKGGKVRNTIAQNKYKLAVSDALLEKTKLDIALDVEKTFYTLLLTIEFAGLNKDILNNTKGHLDFIETRYNGGQASESDVLRLRDSLSNMEQVYETSGNQIESSRVLLRNLLYMDNDVQIRPDGQFTYAQAEIAYDEAFLKALAKRPEIRQYEAQEKADKKAIEIAKADNRPNIYASWDYYSRSHTSLTFSPTKGWNDYNIIGVTFTWPIFDGWLTRAKVEQAIADLKTTQLTKEKTVKDIAAELKNSYLDLKNAIAGIKSAEVEMNLYSDAASVAEKKYKAGIASSLDLDDAALAYKVSLFNKKQAIYDYVSAKARFEKAMGGV